MNLNQIINMVTRIFLRKGVNWGINKGTQMISNRGKSGASVPPADPHHANQAREAAKRARKAAAVTRRIGR
ncbi:hypothetical protein [Pseudotabrizicola algicola]|uniref:Uncharacterized protein n=1 Tax=Pseudotabrizicola algicola TaxID=2709381 RepID=A0A6B3RG04_9RHOB|nr:hypothetical protein [Pseudotabrizicola algicola]NEX44900.1 hypothetical protein [Pseudotabrizicola algicola]